jgi:hypothetical protein
MSQGGYVKKHIVRELTQPQGKLLTSNNCLKIQDTNQHLYKIRLIYNWYTPSPREKEGKCSVIKRDLFNRVNTSNIAQPFKAVSSLLKKICVLPSSIAAHLNKIKEVQGLNKTNTFTTLSKIL